MPRIQLHGRFVVVIDEAVVDFASTGRQGQHLVALLAAQRGRLIARSVVIETLWPDVAPGPRGAANLASVLSKTRTVVAPLAINGGHGCLELPLAPGVHLDAEAADAALHAAEAALARRDWRTTWTRALSALFVLQREFLPGFQADWITRYRDQAEHDWRRALSCYAEACLELGGTELASAERSARKLVAADPMAEHACSLLMRTLDRKSDRAAALAVYERMRRNLLDELGVSPSPECVALYHQLLG